MRNCAWGKFEIPGSMLRIAPEWQLYLDENRARPYSRAHDQRLDHSDRSPPPHSRGMGGRLRL